MLCRYMNSIPRSQIAFALKQAELAPGWRTYAERGGLLKPHFTSMDYLRFANTESGFGVLLTISYS